MKLFLIRHGQSVTNAIKAYTGQLDAPLSDLGRQQAAAIREVLAAVPFDRVYSSDLIRAAETQRIALPAWEGVREPLLREVDVGSVAGQKIDAVIEKYGIEHRYNRDFTPFGGENLDMLYARVGRFIRKMEEKPCENVGLFVHGGVIRAILELKVPEESPKLKGVSQNCAIHVLSYEGGEWSVVDWNYTGQQAR